jgi:hypothetical protein
VPLVFLSVRQNSHSSVDVEFVSLLFCHEKL